MCVVLTLAVGGGRGDRFEERAARVGDLESRRRRRRRRLEGKPLTLLHFSDQPETRRLPETLKPPSVSYKTCLHFSDQPA